MASLPKPKRVSALITGDSTKLSSPQAREAAELPPKYSVATRREDDDKKDGRRLKAGLRASPAGLAPSPGFSWKVLPNARRIPNSAVDQGSLFRSVSNRGNRKASPVDLLPRGMLGATLPEQTAKIATPSTEMRADGRPS